MEKSEKEQIIEKFDELITIMSDKLPYYKRAGGTLGHMCGSIRDRLISLRNLYKSKGH